MNTSLKPLIGRLAVLVLAWPVPASAETLLYNAYKITFSVTMISREPDAQGQETLVRRIITNKQITNYAQGRAASTPVPANEILVVLFADNPFDTDHPFVVALLDATTATVIKVIAPLDNTELGFGPPGGSSVQGTGEANLPALGDTNFGMAATTLDCGFHGSERLTSAGTLLSFTVSASGPSSLTINGQTVPAIVTAASIRASGKPLLALLADLGL